MRLYIIVCFVLMFFNPKNIYGQKEDIYKVSYDIYYNTDYPMMRKADLYIDINKNYSIFKEDLTPFKWKGDNKDNVMIKSADYAMSVSKKMTQKYIKNFNNKILLLEDFAKISYLIEDRYPNFNWKILKETKIINGIECFKATGEYRGNTFEVWFSYDIPLSFGPWKLCGLPGLIIEAKTSNNKYSFIATKVERQDEIIEMPEIELNKVTLKEFLTIKEEFYDRPITVPRDTKIERVKMPRAGIELIYEWEEDK